MTTLATRHISGLDVLIVKEPGRNILIVPVVDESKWEWSPEQADAANGIVGVFLAAQEVPAPEAGQGQAMQSFPDGLIPRSLFLTPAPAREKSSHLGLWLIVPVAVGFGICAAVFGLVWRFAK